MITNLKKHDVDLRVKMGDKVKMITPRIPYTLHHSLIAEAKELGITYNELYIARLSTATVDTEIPDKKV